MTRVHQHLEATLSRIDRFLLEYYEQDLDEDLGVAHFVLEPEDALLSGGQLLIREAGDALEVGIRFGTALTSRFKNPTEVGLHEIGVISEEISHLRTVLYAAESGTKISLLDLEVLGEVDRFLTGLHAPQLLGHLEGPRLNHAKNESLGELCTQQFEERDFLCAPAITELYLQAEALALKHLRLAFSHCWEDSRVNRHSWDGRARSYLTELRRSVVFEGRSVRVFPESA